MLTVKKTLHHLLTRIKLIMKKLLVGMGLVITCITASAQLDTFILDVVVENLNATGGNIRMEIVKSDGDVYKALKVHVFELPTKIKIDSIPKGEYGIRYFYDENKNQKMDSYWVGIPSEGYGFSNNPYSKFGEPAFEKTLFLMDKDKALTLETVNW